MLSWLTEPCCAKVDDLQEHVTHTTTTSCISMLAVHLLTLRGIWVQQQQVLRLDVSVNYIALIVCIRQELQQLPHDPGSITFAEVALQQRAPSQQSQVQAYTHLHSRLDHGSS